MEVKKSKKLNVKTKDEFAVNFAEKVSEAVLKNIIFDEVYDGIKSIEFMRDNGSPNWKQSEWPGWFIEYLVRQSFQNYHNFSEKINKFARTIFDESYVSDDGILIPVDTKCHTLYNKNGKKNSSLIANDKLSIEKAIEQYRQVGFVVANIVAEFDTTGEFKAAHTALKGELSSYSMANLKADVRSRVLKKSFIVDSINIYLVNANNVGDLQIMKQGKNSDGSARNDKYIIPESFEKIAAIS